MTLDKILELIDCGVPVYWKTKAYKLIRDKKGNLLIYCQITGNYQIFTESYKLDDFFVEGDK